MAIHRIALVSTTDRKHGVKASIEALQVNPVEGKDVLIKPNFNTADLCPGSTHNDTLVALVDELWAMGAKSVSLGEWSYPLTAEVMEEKGIIPLMQERDVRIIDFDQLPKSDWIELKPADSHWSNGFRIALPILESECLVSTCCLKTHHHRQPKSTCFRRMKPARNSARPFDASSQKYRGKVGSADMLALQV
ncbi:MAG: DUF362 domain-containing protein [Syntrophobacteraceae bacterium]|jgi:uncharacterized protein (DUF362 family)|nr:DUF362 domain-containing protein [Syntrophobacteraceae bacterium]